MCVHLLLGFPSCVIPMSCHEDHRLTPILEQIVRKINTTADISLTLTPLPGADIAAGCHLPVLLPCMAGTVNEITGAFEKAKIGTLLVSPFVFGFICMK